LRALSYDLEKNLNTPLAEVYGEKPPIRVGLRSGDTTQVERQRQHTRPPHILLTTQRAWHSSSARKKWLPILSSIRWMIVDEIHALAENKRGAHLSLSMERLDQVVREAGGAMQRIGLSATVAPLNEVGKFLVGTRRSCETSTSALRKKLICASTLRSARTRIRPPVTPGNGSSANWQGSSPRNRTTLVFSNTRSGAEAATFWLHQALPELSGQIECHHASLDRDVRQEVEDRLKRGELRAVVCSHQPRVGYRHRLVDLVVMLSTPKGVSRALQRTGRAGHNINRDQPRLLMATNMNDLVECCATVLLARTRQLDPVRLPRAPLDVLAQHIVAWVAFAVATRRSAGTRPRRVSLSRPRAN
jgi:ATP-dependent Lhr-like helicase